MSKPSALTGILGLALAEFGIFTTLSAAAVLFGATALNTICGVTQFQQFQIGGIVGVVAGLAMIYFGIKTFLTNQTKIVNFLTGLVGLELVILSVTLAIATIPTVAGPALFSVLALVGVGLIDIGWKTKFVAPVTKILMKI